MTPNKLLLAFSFSLVSLVSLGCNTQVEDRSANASVTFDSAPGFDGAGQCAVPASVDYECPGGECPDRTGCNWCSCSPAFGSSWSCNMRACGPVAGEPFGSCSVDSDCSGTSVCRFLGGCGASQRGLCLQPTENFFYNCPSITPISITACLCDGSTKKIAVDCSGVHERFLHLGACE